jgi:hypothetical protein
MHAPITPMLISARKNQTSIGPCFDAVSQFLDLFRAAFARARTTLAAEKRGAVAGSTGGERKRSADTALLSPPCRDRDVSSPTDIRRQGQRDVPALPPFRQEIACGRSSSIPQ